jgi:hypothetical protein
MGKVSGIEKAARRRPVIGASLRPLAVWSRGRRLLVEVPRFLLNCF